MCKKAGNKWLLGTDEPTMLDIHCGAFWDMIYCRDGGDVYKLTSEVFQRDTFAPAWTAFVERFRSYPAFKPYRFRKLAVQKHGERSRDWPKGEYVSLSHSVLEGVFEAEP